MPRRALTPTRSDFSFVIVVGQRKTARHDFQKTKPIHSLLWPPIAVRLLRRTRWLPSIDFVGLRLPGEKIASRIASSFFRSRNRVFNVQRSHTTKNSSSLFNDLTVQHVEYAPCAQTYTKSSDLECGQHPEWVFFCFVCVCMRRPERLRVYWYWFFDEYFRENRFKVGEML